MFLRQAVAHVVSTTIMTTLVACAFFDKFRSKTQEPVEISEEELSPDDLAHPKSSVQHYVEKYGYHHETHTLETADGFILVVDRIFKRKAEPGISPLFLSISHLF